MVGDTAFNFLHCFPVMSQILSNSTRASEYLFIENYTFGRITLLLIALHQLFQHGTFPKEVWPVSFSNSPFLFTQVFLNMPWLEVLPTLPRTKHSATPPLKKQSAEITVLCDSFDEELLEQYTVLQTLRAPGYIFTWGLLYSGTLEPSNQGALTQRVLSDLRGHANSSNHFSQGVVLPPTFLRERGVWS